MGQPRLLSPSKSAATVALPWLRSPDRGTLLAGETVHSQGGIDHQLNIQDVDPAVLVEIVDRNADAQRFVDNRLHVDHVGDPILFLTLSPPDSSAARPASCGPVSGATHRSHGAIDHLALPPGSQRLSGRGPAAQSFGAGREALLPGRTRHTWLAGGRSGARADGAIGARRRSWLCFLRASAVNIRGRRSYHPHAPLAPHHLPPHSDPAPKASRASPTVSSPRPG